ncbi:hypothetical protein [Ferrovibrio xuzhouensis]|uniref:Uncharacterized protein n=1 Tax=Ferrovibrio xuzhouensis TaxID=1576914 RepID=A0ABV7VCI6_9PROT
MSSLTTKPEHPDGDRKIAGDAIARDIATVEIVPNSFGVVLPGGDWWVNEPVWDQAVRRLTAPPLPPAASQHPSSQKPAQHGDVTAVTAASATPHHLSMKGR